MQVITPLVLFSRGFECVRGRCATVEFMVGHDLISGAPPIALVVGLSVCVPKLELRCSERVLGGGREVLCRLV